MNQKFSTKLFVNPPWDKCILVLILFGAVYVFVISFLTYQFIAS